MILQSCKSEPSWGACRVQARRYPCIPAVAQCFANRRCTFAASKMSGPTRRALRDGQGWALREVLAVQEGTCDITPFPLSHCHANSYRLNRLKGGISAVGRNRPFFHILKLKGTIFGP